MAVPEPTPSRRPGRPPRVSATTIETAALRLFVDQGFAATTVSDIARRCQVSRTTVFRYFPTKADLVWAGFDSHVAQLRSLLQGVPEQRTTMAAVLAAAVGAFEASVDQDGVWLTRYRVLRNSPELGEAEWARWADWRAAVAEFVAARIGGSPADVIPSAVAGAVLSAYLAVHNAWATDDQEPPEPAAALRRELLPVCSAVETLVTARDPAGLDPRDEGRPRP